MALSRKKNQKRRKSNLEYRRSRKRNCDERWKNRPTAPELPAAPVALNMDSMSIAPVLAAPASLPQLPLLPLDQFDVAPQLPPSQPPPSQAPSRSLDDVESMVEIPALPALLEPVSPDESSVPQHVLSAAPQLPPSQPPPSQAPSRSLDDVESMVEVRPAIPALLEPASPDESSVPQRVLSAAPQLPPTQPPPIQIRKMIFDEITRLEILAARILEEGEKFIVSHTAVSDGRRILTRQPPKHWEETEFLFYKKKVQFPFPNVNGKIEWLIREAQLDCLDTWSGRRDNGTIEHDFRFPHLSRKNAFLNLVQSIRVKGATEIDIKYVNQKLASEFDHIDIADSGVAEYKQGYLSFGIVDGEGNLADISARCITPQSELLTFPDRNFVFRLINWGFVNLAKSLGKPFFMNLCNDIAKWPKELRMLFENDI